jgi:hypothetical protein
MFYLYNTTNNSVLLDDVGIEIKSHDNLEVPVNRLFDFHKENGDLHLNLINGNLVLTEDSNLPPVIVYSASEAIDYFNHVHHAHEVKFSNSTNGFQSTDVQSAIEEVQANIVLQFPSFLLTEDAGFIFTEDDGFVFN